MTLRRLAATAVAGAAGWAAMAGLGAVPVLAAACASGTTCSPSSLSVSPHATLVAKITHSLTARTFTMRYTEEVYSDPANEYCAGCLDWILKVKNTSASGGDSIQRINISSFVGWSSDLGADTANTAPDGLTGGHRSPVSVHPNANRGVLAWNYQGSASQQLKQGQTTVLLEVETNATTYVDGLVSAQDGSTVTGPGFAPTAPPHPEVPEVPWAPALGLAGGAAAGGFAVRRSGGRSTSRRRPPLSSR